MADSAQASRKKEIDSFKKMILGMLPAANKIIKEALKIRKPKIGADGKVIKIKPIPPKSVDLARYVLDQYSKMLIPADGDVHAVHIVDHAALAQIKQAQDVMEEMSRHNLRNDRGIDVSLN